MAGKTHTRLSCPCCGMMTSPGRLDQDFPVKFAAVTFRSGGRDKGFYHWDHQPDVPNRDRILAALRDKLARCLDALDLELKSPTPLLPSVPTGFRPVPVVLTFSRLLPRSPADLIARFNPILSL